MARKPCRFFTVLGLAGLLLLSASTPGPAAAKSAVRIGQIKYSALPYGDRLTLNCQTKIEPKLEYLTGPTRLVLTFSDSILLANKVAPQAAAGKYVKRYWASQFTRRPPSCRLVIELTQKITPTFKYDQPGQIQIVFGREPDAEPAATAAPVSTTAATVVATTAPATTTTADPNSPKAPTPNSVPATPEAQTSIPPSTSVSTTVPTPAPATTQPTAPAPVQKTILPPVEEIRPVQVISQAPVEIISEIVRPIPAAGGQRPGQEISPTPAAAETLAPPPPRLVRLAYERTGNIYQIHLTASQPVTDLETDELTDPPRLVLDLPGVIFDLPEKDLPIRDDVVWVIRSGQFDPQTSRVVVELTEDKTSFLASADETNKEIYVFFIPQITKISSQTSAQEETVRIDFNRRTSYQIRKLSEPPRLLIDFPQAVFRAAGLTKPASGPVQQIRGSQWQSYPPVSRVVLDLQKDLPYSAALTGEQTSLVIKLPVPREFTRVEEITSYRSLRGRIIAINPGHGGKDPGAPSHDRQKPEKEYTLSTALKLAGILNSAGANVLLTREDDTNVTLENVVRFAKNNRADILVDFHYNSSYSAKTAGTETYYYKPIDLPLASAVHQKLIQNLRLEDKGVRKAKFYTLNHSDIPAVLVEPAHLSNPQELKLVKQDAVQQRIAESVAAGLDVYFRENP